MPEVYGYHHLAIQVKDLKRAERFYVDVLGLRVARRWLREDGVPGERSVWLSVGSPLGDEFIALEASAAERPPTPVRRPPGGLHLPSSRLPPRRRPALA